MNGAPSAVKSPRGAGGLRPAALALVFAAVALGLYAPSFTAPFLSDDFLYLEHNPALALPLARALHRVLLEPYYCVGNWSPLHQLWLLATWRAFGDAPALHRIASVLLHAAVSLAVVATGRRAGLARGAAIAAGALFLVHPAALEAVAWVSQSKTTLAVGFALVALERWLAQLRAPSGGRLAAATAAGVAALLAKPAALPLLGILAVAVWTHGVPGRRRRAVPDAIPLAIVTAIAFALNLQAQATQGGVAPWFGGGPLATARILPWLAWRYVRLVVAPFDLVHGVHPEPTHGVGDPRFWGPLLALAAVAAAVVAACRARYERALFAAWFAGMLLPVLQLVPMINLFGDRYLYAALPGALWLVCDVADAAARRAGARGPRLAAGATLAAGVALGSVTLDRARVWADPEALYREASLAYPDGRQGWTGLGAVRHQRGDLSGAAEAYLRSLAVFPDDGHVRHLLGRVRLRQGLRELALYDLEASLRLAPGHPDAGWTRRRVARLRAQGIAPQEDPPP